MRIQFKILALAWDAIPEIDIRRTPSLLVPLRDLVDAVALNQVLRELRHQGIPGFETPGGRDVRLVPEGMECVWVEGKLLWHEAYLDHGTDTVLQQAIIDLIDVREIVDRVSVLILVVDTDLVVQDGVEPDVLKICGF